MILMVQNQFKPIPAHVSLHRDSHGVFRGVAFADFDDVCDARTAFAMYNDLLEVCDIMLHKH